MNFASVKILTGEFAVKIVLQLKNLDDGNVSEVVVDRSPILLGRSKICDVPVNDPILSRQHCSIEVNEKGEIKVQDLESANGTFVGGKKITSHGLLEGSSFQIGRTEIKIVKADTAEQEEKTLEEILLEQEASASTAKPAKQAKKSKPAEELTMKTPVALKAKSPKPTYKTKDWVQVTLLWKGEIADIQCFDIGDIVTLGEAAENDFLVAIPSLPKVFQVLKVLQNGIELHLHPAMRGMIETRGAVKTLDDLRATARQTDLGLSTFVQFSDRCLIEIGGNFSIYVQSIRLNLTAPITAPLIGEPLYASILTLVLAFFIPFMFVVENIAQTQEVKKEEPAATVKVEAPPPPDAPKPPPPPPPPPPKKEPKKVEAPKPQVNAKMSGKEGQGAKAKGDEGKSGRTTGRLPAKAKPLGLMTDSTKAVRSAPKGAFGKELDPNRAKRGLRPDQGVGSGKPKPAGTGGQAPSKTIKPDVKVEDTGVLGALGGAGGGGSASSGGTMAGKGLGGTLEGSLEGQERGADLDVKGSGGRGAKGLGLGGGGTAIDVSGGLGTKGKGGGREGFGLGSSGKKGEAAVSYSGEDIEVRDGLTREEVERVVRANQAAIQACYERALVNSSGQDLRGRVRMEWFVNADGRVEAVARKSGQELGDFLSNCMANAIRTWQFPRPRGGSGANVSWGWTFQRGM